MNKDNCKTKSKTGNKLINIKWEKKIKSLVERRESYSKIMAKIL